MVEPVNDRKNPGQTSQEKSGTPAGGVIESSSVTPDDGSGGGIRKPLSLMVSLFTALVYLLVIIGVIGYAILIFRDKDERVKVAADYIENELGKAQQLMDIAPGRLSLLLGGQKTPAPGEDVSGERTQVPEPSNPAALKPPADDNQEAQSAPANENAAAPAPEPALQPQPDLASETAKPVESAPPPAVAETKTSASAKDDLSSMDLVNALEGRIEALSEELKSLREKQTQAIKEAPATLGAGGSSSEAATVVIAFALQKELDAGRPYADEIAALTRTGADPALLGVLATMAESGAPTGVRLRENFKPLAKKIRAEEPTKEEDLATHIIHGASKLVRVRPTGTEQPETLDGNLAKIDAALAHDDYAAAAAAFAALPEWARSQAGEFAQTLDKRLAVAQASESLLHGAIAALGGVRK
jgi:hypothetical protein